eukprot:1334931-Amphidinium_carterae.1
MVQTAIQRLASDDAQALRQARVLDCNLTQARILDCNSCKLAQQNTPPLRQLQEDASKIGDGPKLSSNTGTDLELSLL